MDAHRIAQEASRLLPVARRVLERYPFEVRQLEHLATHSNVMYRLITDDGRQLVLRVGTPTANTRLNIEHEVAWLSALNRDTDLDVVSPVPTGYGGMIVAASDPESGETRPCVLFSWVPGHPLGDGAGSFGYRLLGRMSAHLQQHGKEWRPSHPWSMRAWREVFYYDEESDPVVIYDSRFDHLFSSGRRSLIDKATALAGAALEEEWRIGSPQVVHGDLHEWNVHTSGSRLHAFDFEDVMIATPAQDASVSLYSSRSSDRRDEIKAAFRKGFEDIAPWPIESEDHLDGLHAARQIMLMNYAARSLPMGEAVGYLDQVTPWLKTYVERYG